MLDPCLCPVKQPSPSFLFRKGTKHCLYHSLQSIYQCSTVNRASNGHHKAPQSKDRPAQGYSLLWITVLRAQ